VEDAGIDEPGAPRQISGELRSTGTSCSLHDFPGLSRFMKVASPDLTSARKALYVTLMAVLAPGVGSHLCGQNLATVRVEENLRAEPQGSIIGRVMPGATFPIVSAEDQWVQVDVGGWMWTASLRTTDRSDFPLSVSAAPSENLRGEPQGEILAVLVQGTLLEELGEVTGWKRVRRRAWIWHESVEVESGVTGGETAPEPAPTGAAEGWLSGGREGAPLLSGPDGDTLARTEPGANLQVLAREGNWVRVRLEGWTWAPIGESPDAPDMSPVSDVTPEEVGQDPGAYRGRVVSWNLQFVSLERAEKVRTDFFEGEPFLLARTSTSGSSFVYVAVPPDRLGEVEGLVPLERINVVGRIRTGAAALTGNPILDLLELSRVPRG
jgi:hypothetical protein